MTQRTTPRNRPSGRTRTLRSRTTTATATKGHLGQRHRDSTAYARMPKLSAPSISSSRRRMGNDRFRILVDRMTESGRLNQNWVGVAPMEELRALTPKQTRQIRVHRGAGEEGERVSRRQRFRGPLCDAASRGPDRARRRAAGGIPVECDGGQPDPSDSLISSLGMPCKRVRTSPWTDSSRSPCCVKKVPASFNRNEEMQLTTR